MIVHVDADGLQAGLDEILRSPASDGIVELIVRRPVEDEREVLEEGLLDVDEGLVGDAWRTRGSSSTEDGLAHTERQLTLMNSRVIALEPIPVDAPSRLRAR